jgi:hypothetical protein
VQGAARETPAVRFRLSSLPSHCFRELQLVEDKAKDIALQSLCVGSSNSGAQIALLIVGVAPPRNNELIERMLQESRAVSFQFFRCSGSAAKIKTVAKRLAGEEGAPPQQR